MSCAIVCTNNRYHARHKAIPKGGEQFIQVYPHDPGLFKDALSNENLHSDDM